MAGGDAILTREQREAFWREGFVFVPDLLTREEAEACRDRYEGMFAGSFDTGMYPQKSSLSLSLSLSCARAFA